MKRIVLLLLMLSVCHAALVVTQTAPETVTSGGVLRVDITVENTGSSTEEVVVEHAVGYAPVEPKPYRIEIEGVMTPEFYYWNATIPAGGKAEFFFREQLTMASVAYFVPAAKAYAGGEEYESNTLHVEIVCDRDGVCDPSKAENIVSCPEDCATGSDDGVCDGEADGVCDPDCAGLRDVVDPDCGAGTTAPQAAAPEGPEEPAPGIGLEIVAVVIALAALVGAGVFLKRKK